MTGLPKTSEALLKALQEATTHPLGPEELEQQRVSFILGSLSEKSDVTRARVEEVLAEQEGKKALSK
jgi:hypothetical protein